MEFLVLLEKGKFSDYELMENKKLKVHKRFVELRTNSSVKQIEDILVNYKENEIMIFLKWVYSGNIINYMIVNEICKQLGIENLYSKSFYDDLFKLYKDEESKNFNLLVKQEDFSDDNDDDDDDDNENFEEIPVHKYILYTRSGLFREMFDQIDENSDSITDYSKKSIESLEIFVKYLYTNKIELTADDDPQLVVEELQDAVDYYQLSKYSNLPTICKHLKNNF
ncbi:pep-cterm sorting domain-containing protein [Anaeramoeba flamelloides]|uniref:Pep-cterm sorting domain-containing protein n=1 Tax=Anaeramoeba flamelloides TaxID=1746091 RepID=A0AAV8A3N0_9EUKA|nr:pep-cterm sorting domain-containing protein [Anaeramoeba flamelloides]